MISKIMTYLREVRTEMTRVTWSGKEELINSTKVVIIISLLFSLFVFFADKILNKVVAIILRMD